VKEEFVVKLLHRFVSKNRYAALGLLVGIATLITGATSALQPATASAAACDKVNIIYCGLTGSSASGYISSFKADYTRGSDNGHNDLQKIYNWAGASSSSVAGMTTANTKLGTMYRDGTIKVDGQIVGTDAWVSARFNGGSGFTEISSGVWARKTTTSLAEASAPVLVHFDAQGNADFAVMTGCGNAVKFTKKPKPQPKPALSCVGLAMTGEELTYHFQAKASASNTTITSYVFTYSDGTKKTINTSATTATDTHTFAKSNYHYVVSVAVNSKDLSNVTSAACQTSLTTPGPKECKPGIPVGDSRCTECKPGVPAGDARCTECKPGVPMGSPSCTPCQYNGNLPSDSSQCVPPTTPPTELPNTGAGNVVGLIGGVIVLGGLGHQLVLRKLRG
jgi:hypothetical protein